MRGLARRDAGRRWRRGVARAGAAAALAAAVLPAVASAGTSYRYTGGDGESWTDASNWSPSTGFPGQSPADAAVVDNGFRPVLARDLTIAALTIAGNGGRDGSGTLTVSGAGRQTWGRALLRGTGATILGPGTDVVLDGGVRLDEAATLVLAGTAAQTAGNAFELGDGLGPDAVTLDNRGTTTLDGSGVVSSTPASGRLLNSGTLKRSAPGPAGISRLSNTGQVLAAAGQLWIHGGESPTTGRLTAEGPGVIGFAGGAYVAESGSEIGGTGTIDVFTGELSVMPGATFAPGALRLTGADVNDESAGLVLGADGTAGSLYMEGHGLRSGAARLDVAGPSTIRNGSFAGSGVTDFAGAVTVPDGALRISDTARVRFGDGGSIAGAVGMVADDAADAPVLDNAGGTLTLFGSAQVHRDGGTAGARVVNGPDGTIAIAAGAPSAMVPIDNRGHIEVAHGATLRALGGLDVDDQGSLEVAGTLEMGATPLSLRGGSLRGAGTVHGSVANVAATVDPGASPGSLSVTADYFQGAGGTLRAEIDATDPGGGYDELKVGGTATLDGTLAIVTGASFDPPTDAVFEVLTATGGLTGRFASVTGWSTATKAYSVRYLDGPPGAVRLEVAEASPDIRVDDCDDPRLSTLESVGGDLTIDIGGDCPSVAAPRLNDVGGALTVTGSMTEIDLRSLDTVGGALDISGATLTTADFGELDDVGGALDISGTALTSADFTELDVVDGTLDVSSNGALTEIDFSSLDTVGEGLEISGNGQLTEIALDSLVSVGGNLAIETGATHLDVSRAHVAGDMELAGTGTEVVAAQTAAGATAVTLLSGVATMAALVPDGAFEGFVPFAVERLEAALTEPEDGRAADGSPAVVDPLVGYRFTFSDPQLDAQATLTFTVDVSRLDDHERRSVLTALEEGRLTLAVKDDGGGAYQSFAVCGEGESPAVDGCVAVTALDADGGQLPAGSAEAPAHIRLEGVTGHFSTWAVVVTAPRDTPRPGDGVVHAGETDESAPAPAAARDTTVTGVTVGAPKRRRLGRKGLRLTLRVSSRDEPVAVVSKGEVSISGKARKDRKRRPAVSRAKRVRLTTTRARVRAGEVALLRHALAGGTRRAGNANRTLRRALASGRRASVRMTVTLADAAGNVKRVKRTIHIR